jgi:hypothetical protein
MANPWARGAVGGFGVCVWHFENQIRRYRHLEQPAYYDFFFIRAAAEAASTTLSTSSRQLKISAARIG